MPNLIEHPTEFIASKILVIRGHKVILDTDLAELYEVENRSLIQAVKRNQDRFPDDFMFQLTKQEVSNLRSQSVISSSTHGGRRTPPYAFTEQGVAMLSSVLRSSTAVAVNIQIMRTFVQLRELLGSNKELAAQLEKLERKLEDHDQTITGILRTIHQLMTPEDSKKRPIGFVHPEEIEEDD